LTLSVSLDKALTRDLAAAAGLNVPPGRVVRSSDEVDSVSAQIPFPLFVKPRYEGSAKGITSESRVHNTSELRRQVDRITGDYRQDALVEQFVVGSEYTVALVGHDPVRTLPALQRAVEKQSGIGLHALERRGLPTDRWDYALPGTLNAELERRLTADALGIFHKLECVDFARVDFRVDSDGQVWFLEINPLPTFAPDGTFAVLAEMEGMEYTQFLAGVFESAIARIARRPH